MVEESPRPDFCPSTKLSFMVVVEQLDGRIVDGWGALSLCWNSLACQQQQGTIDLPFVASFGCCQGKEVGWNGLTGSKITPKEFFVPLHKDAIPNSEVRRRLQSSDAMSLRVP
jgi:hypothetical protein